MDNTRNAARTYYAPKGGLPPQSDLVTDRSVFTEAYAVIPKREFSDIVTSYLPHWDNTRLWIIAGGGSDRPEPDATAEGVLFVVEGEIAVTIGGKAHRLTPGGYAFLPPSSGWTLRNDGGATARFRW